MPDTSGNQLRDRYRNLEQALRTARRQRWPDVPGVRAQVALISDLFDMPDAGSDPSFEQEIENIITTKHHVETGMIALQHHADRWTDEHRGQA